MFHFPIRKVHFTFAKNIVVRINLRHETQLFLFLSLPRGICFGFKSNLPSHSNRGTFLLLCSGMLKSYFLSLSAERFDYAHRRLKLCAHHFAVLLISGGCYGLFNSNVIFYFYPTSVRSNYRICKIPERLQGLNTRERTNSTTDRVQV